MDVSIIPNDYQPRADLMQGKNILVTGAGDGIGRAAAMAYAAHGATVLLLGRTASKLEAVYDAIEASGAPTPAMIEMDFATAPEESYTSLANELGNEFQHLDGLLHNAALLGDRRSIQSAGYADWQNVMQVNVNAQFILTRTLLPLLKLAKSASLIFT